jgi:FkbM family methyltransferase
LEVARQVDGLLARIFSIWFSYRNMTKALGEDFEPIEQKTQTLPNGYKVTYRNDCEFEVIYDDIFERTIYFFETDNTEPYIIDCGGHIGLAVLYFKSLYPRANIVTFEPNPETFALLQKNIAQNNLRNVEAVNMALTRDGDKEAILYVGENFLKTWDSTDTIEPHLWVNMHDYRGISVPSTRLSLYINGKVDFLKLDIEGAERDVLDELDGKLPAIKAITLEYHQNPANLAERKLEKIVETLKAVGFKYEIFHHSERIELGCLPKNPVYQLIVRARR